MRMGVQERRAEGRATKEEGTADAAVDETTATAAAGHRSLPEIEGAQYYGDGP